MNKTTFLVTAVAVAAAAVCYLSPPAESKHSRNNVGLHGVVRHVPTSRLPVRNKSARLTHYLAAAGKRGGHVAAKTSKLHVATMHGAGSHKVATAAVSPHSMSTHAASPHAISPHAISNLVVSHAGSTGASASAKPVTPAVAAYNCELGGIEFYKQGKYAQAVAKYKQALSFNKTADLYYNLGISLEQLDDLRGAAAAAQKAIELEPHNTAYIELFSRVTSDTVANAPEATSPSETASATVEPEPVRANSAQAAAALNELDQLLSQTLNHTH